MQHTSFQKTFQVRHPRPRESKLPRLPGRVAALSARLEAESHFKKITPIHPASRLADDGRAE